MTLTSAVLIFVSTVCLMPAWAMDFTVVAPGEDSDAVEFMGRHTYNAMHLGRYRDLQINGSPDRRYRIPTGPVTRDTYMGWAERRGLDHLLTDDPTRRGPYILGSWLPALVKLVQTDNPAWGEACVRALLAYDQWVRAEVKQKGWHHNFIDEPRLLLLFGTILSERGFLDRNEPWFRELVLFHTRHLHVWGTEATFWRGPMYRAQSEGNAKALAVKWYPDIPEAAEWQVYAQKALNDWWPHRDIMPDDTGYLFGNLHIQFLGAYLLEWNEFFTDPQMRRVWDRLVHEVGPDGAIIPYGPHGGWNSTAPSRIWMLELLASKTGEGRYRYVAHKLMNYLLYQEEHYVQHHQLQLTGPMALAWLFADDSIQPVAPAAGSQLLERRRIIRPRHREASEKYLGPLDPDPGRAQICCNMVFSGEVVPSKLTLRSGWGPGDFFVLVDLFANHQAPGILGMTRWASCLGQGMNSKGANDEGRLFIEDLGGTAPVRANAGGELQETYLEQVEVKGLQELVKATFAQVAVQPYRGFPVVYHREFAFIKNRFLVARDIMEFEEGFLARVASTIKTQNVGPQVGTHWANTYFDEIHTASFPQPINNPPWDLLVWFAPQPGRKLQIVDLTSFDPRAYDAPAQLRYTWEGLAQRGDRLLFTQVYYPHVPNLELPTSNVPGAVRPQDLAGTAGADGIHVLRDDTEATVLRFAFDADREEWVVFNPEGGAIAEGSLETDARFVYVDTRQGEVRSVSAVDGSYLRLGGAEVFRQAARGDFET